MMRRFCFYLLDGCIIQQYLHSAVIASRSMYSKHTFITNAADFGEGMRRFCFYILSRRNVQKCSHIAVIDSRTICFKTHIVPKIGHFSRSRGTRKLCVYILRRNVPKSSHSAVMLRGGRHFETHIRLFCWSLTSTRKQRNFVPWRRWLLILQGSFQFPHTPNSIILWIPISDVVRGVGKGE
jgi:hypothetical protein